MTGGAMEQQRSHAAMIQAMKNCITQLQVLREQCEAALAEAGEEIDVTP